MGRGRHHRALIRISRRRWREVLLELARRGEGRKEAGAFLLGSAAAEAGSTAFSAVCRVAYYDDLDPSCLTGGISMSGKAYDQLWALCAEHYLRVVADVHTHPGKWVEQSHTDSSNPMIGLRGHVAIIVPFFAHDQVNVDDLGIHLYEGNHRWTRMDGHAMSIVLTDLWEWRQRFHMTSSRLLRAMLNIGKNS
jgi:hypothetical protein